MPYPTKAIANAILNKAALAGEKVSPLKLQKLIYYAAGYFIAAYDEALIDSAIEAWDYGPVVPELYREFREYGSGPILGPAREFDWESEASIPVPVPVGDARVDRVIDYVWKTYGKYSAVQLSDMTHADGSPWDKTKKANPGIKNADIQSSMLKEHFSSLVKRKHG